MASMIKCEDCAHLTTGIQRVKGAALCLDCMNERGWGYYS